MTEARGSGDNVGSRLPALIGVGFGVLFFLLNTGQFGSPWAWVVRGAGLLAGVAVAGMVLMSRAGPAPPPEPRALRTYVRCVAAEGIALPVGSIGLARAGFPDLSVPWVVLVVGVHFLPFAPAFRRSEYRTLGLAMIAAALVGAWLALAVSDVWSAVTGVVAGCLLLAFAATFGRDTSTAST